MAISMNYQEIKNGLKTPESVAAAPFELLKGITDLLNTDNNESEDKCRELLCHALEHRESFGNYQSVLDGLARELGLFPYLSNDLESLSLSDTLAYEYHRPKASVDGIVFHREQAEMYRRLLAGENLILSAPTSFGKSKIIDFVIDSDKFSNIAVVVPTIALIDETRRRLMRFSSKFKIITQVSQEPAEKNIFIFTAERLISYEKLPHIDFFVIDEFYKIGAVDTDQKRVSALNQAFYRLSKGGGQFYLLGPCVHQIPDGVEGKFQCHFCQTNFATVASDLIPVKKANGRIQALTDLAKKLKGEPTIIYCKSPRSANDVAIELFKAFSLSFNKQNLDASKWMRDNFHNDWILAKCVEIGIGLHHGRLPRSLGQFVVRAFNNDKLDILVCTSTLIEGVNTKAKNVIIYDNTIARKKIDFFTFNNIKGRSGRMFEHFVGRVYLFNEQPEEYLPFVDFPVFSQKDSVPNSLLINLDEKDLTDNARASLASIINQEDLPIKIMRKHSCIEPENLLNLARHLKNSSTSEQQLLAWTGFPEWKQLCCVCELSWKHLLDNHGKKAGVSSGRQLAMKISQLRNTPDIRQRIDNELRGNYAANSPDEAIERVFEFDRNWATFEMPRILRAFSDVRAHVHNRSGDYYFFAGQLENLFRPVFQVALEEFGLPLQISDKIAPRIGKPDTLDEALDFIRKLPIDGLALSTFEYELLKDCKDNI
jgi:hypothetical protein